MDGRPEPAVTERNGLPLLEPFGERLVEMHAWRAAAGRPGRRRYGLGFDIVRHTERVAQGVKEHDSRSHLWEPYEAFPWIALLLALVWATVRVMRGSISAAMAS
jgi:hypothetical protein